MRNILVAVDLQNDFVDGVLGTPEAQAIVENAAKKISSFEGEIFVTYDTHFDSYMNTLEGKKLPVPHCIKGTKGHELNPVIAAALNGKAFTSVEKSTFGSFEIAEALKGETELSFTLIGLCTDICVISNALILRAAFPDAVITVDASCCAGVSPATHEAALTTMKCCQIDVI